MLDQRRQAGWRLIENADADAQGDRLGCGEALNGSFMELFAQHVAQTHDSLLGRVPQQNHEFIAAQPGRYRACGQYQTNHLAQCNQQSVARRMPVQIVDQLEIIDIDQQQSTRTGGGDLVQQTWRPRLEGAPVIHGGQWVPCGQPLYPFFSAVAHGTGHRQCNQHDRHHPFDQGNLDNPAPEDGKVYQRARNERRYHLGEVKQAMPQQHIAQLRRSGTQ